MYNQCFNEINLRPAYGVGSLQSMVFEGSNVLVDRQAGFIKPDELSDDMMVYAYTIPTHDYFQSFLPGQTIFVSEDSDILLGDTIFISKYDVITNTNKICIGKCLSISLAGKHYNLVLANGENDEFLTEISSTEVAFLAKVLPYFARPN